MAAVQWKTNYEEKCTVPQNLYAKSFHTFATFFPSRVVKCLGLIGLMLSTAVVVFMPSICEDLKTSFDGRDSAQIPSAVR